MPTISKGLCKQGQLSGPTDSPGPAALPLPPALLLLLRLLRADNSINSPPVAAKPAAVPATSTELSRMLSTKLPTLAPKLPVLLLAAAAATGALATAVAPA
jgi:hypothetical protein